MSFTTVCPNCDARLTAPDTVRGKKVKCKKCDEPFVARPAAGGGDHEDDSPARPAKAAAAKARPRPARDEDDAPRRPAKSRRPADDDEDDEPRPKTKKKGKKKPQGSPVPLIVMIVVGLVVLAGAGVGIYFAFFYEEKVPDSAVAKGDGPPPPPPGPGGLSGGPGATAPWVEQHDAEGRYRVKFPSAPQTQNVTQQTPAGPVSLKVYLAGGQTEAFVCTHQQLPADRGGATDDQILDQAIEVTKQQAQGATAGPVRPITYQSLPGRELTLTFPGKKGAMVVRVILAGDRVIAISAVGDTASPDAPRVKQFFESLKIE